MSNSDKQYENIFKHNKTRALVLGIIIFIFLVLTALLLFSFFKLPDNLRNIFLIFPVVLLFSICILTVIVMKLFSSLDMINKKAEILSQGNLNISDIMIDKTKGLESLAIAFNDMKSNFLSFIELTKGNIVVLSEAINKVSSSIEMSYKGNEQIAVSMSQVAEKAQEQLKLVKENIDDVEASSSRIEKITDSIEGIEKYLGKTVETTGAGTAKLEDFYTQLSDISDNLDSTSQFTEKLNQEISKINEISEFIIQVSDQLSLLGLNASIEAARSGEAGKGFTVVANEIRELSGKTKEGIIKINSIVAEITESNGNVNDSINSFVTSFSESKEKLNSVKESFSTINEQGEVLNKDMKEIYNEINLVSSFTKETKAKGIKLYDASNEISSKNQNVAAVTEEALAELEHITEHTSTLNDMLVGITNLVRKFNTSILPVAKSSDKKLKLAFLSVLDHEFWYAVRRGAIYAQNELSGKNAEVDYFGFDGGSTAGKKLTAKMKECIDNNYDGIAIPPFFPDTIPLVEEASKKGIAVVVFNCEFEVKTSRLAYFGPNTYDAGKLAAQLIVKALGGGGNVIMVGRDSSSRIHGIRRTAFLDTIKKNKKIKLVSDIISEDDGDAVYEGVKKYLSNNKDVQGIFVTGGGIGSAAKAIEELGLIGKIKVVGFDHSKEIFEYIKKGLIYAAIGQDPFGQGHDPLVWLYNYIMTGKKVEDENTWSRLDVIDGSNVNDLLAL